MSTQNRYTLYHPKWYRRPVSVWWWLQSRRYTGFVLRELTSVPVAFFALVFMWQIAALLDGPEAYEQFLARMRTPTFLVLHVLSFGAIMFHALTWFHAAPKAMVVHLAGKRVPSAVIVALNYGGWFFLSIVVWIDNRKSSDFTKKLS